MASINFALLRKQRDLVLNLRDNPDVNIADAPMLDGVVNLLDDLIDRALDAQKLGSPDVTLQFHDIDYNDDLYESEEAA